MPIQNFRNISELLFSGDVIDEYRHKELFDDISTGNTLSDLNEHYEMWGKQCVLTADGMGYYLKYLSVKDPDALKSAKAQIDLCRDTLGPFVDFLQWTSILSANDRVLTTGQELRLDVIYKHLEDNVALQRSIRNIRDNLRIQNNASKSKDNIDYVLDWFERNGYLEKVGTAGIVYRALPKWSMHEACMMVIARENNIEKAEVVKQEALF